MKKKATPNMIDVAQKAGVSPATVSRVIGKKSVVSSETVVKVQKAIDELQYEIERPVKRSTKKNLIAVIVPDILDPFFSVILQGIGDIARMHKYNIILCNSKNSENIESANLSLLFESNVDGIIIIPSGNDVGLADRLIEENIPYVFLDRVIDREDISSVTSDDEDGAYQAVKFLLHLGHRDILYIGGDKELSTEKNRLKGFKKAMVENGVPIQEELIRECSFRSEMIYEETQKIIRSNLKFTAVFAASDAIGLRVEKALQDVGKSVPDDVSIIGYGDLPYSEFISLTTVSSPAYEMGKNAIIALLDLLEGRVQAPHRVLLKPSVIFRSSCKSLYANN